MSEYDWKALTAPFAPDEIKWRIQRKNKDATKAAFIPYVDARTVQERLDQVVGQENWRNEKPEPGADGGILCGLSIRIDGEWVTKWDGAENTSIEAIKGGLSDGFKRSAVLWGIARYLYGADEIWTEINQFGDSQHPEKLILKFGGKPLYPEQQSSKSHIDDPRSNRLDTGASSEKPAQPKGAKVARPFTTFAALVEWLRQSALDMKASENIISTGQASNIAQAMQKHLTEDARHFLIWSVWEVESSKELTEKEFLAAKAWCASPIAQLEAEAKLVEAAYAAEVERDLANNG